MNSSFSFQRSAYEAIESVSDETEKGKLYRAVFRYGITGEVTELDGALNGIFLLIKAQIDSYSTNCRNGKKGGRPKKSKTPVIENEKGGFDNCKRGVIENEKGGFRNYKIDAENNVGNEAEKTEKGGFDSYEDGIGVKKTKPLSPDSSLSLSPDKVSSPETLSSNITPNSDPSLNPSLAKRVNGRDAHVREEPPEDELFLGSFDDARKEELQSELDTLASETAERNDKDVLKQRINKLFHRKDTTTWSDKELKQLAVIVKRNGVFDEMSEIETLYNSPDYQYQRHDIITFLNNWSGEYDRALQRKNEKGYRHARYIPRNG